MPTSQVRDPVHGFIELDEEEWNLVDTKVFQRLRGIRQLALATLVYPGATHTRFEHSLGVRHVAGRMAERLELSPDDQRLVKRAALLHDVGHGPFSHVSEEALALINVAEGNHLTHDQPIHEFITHRIIETDDQINHYIADAVVEKVVSVLSERGPTSILADIITSPVDADKQDYLLRDSLACGVEYGHYDIDRLIGTMQTLEDRHDKYIAFSSGGTQSLEQFVLAKYYMNSQVYRHKVRRISDAMILRGLLLGATEDKIQYIRDLFIFDNCKEYFMLYSSSDDLSLIAMSRKDCLCHTWFYKIFNLLFNRHLLKEVFTIRVKDLPPEVRQVLVDDVDHTVVKQIEQDIAEILKCDPQMVIFDDYKIGSTFGERDSSEATLEIVDDEGRHDFSERSIIFSSIQNALQERCLSVYGIRSHDLESARGRQEAEDVRAGIKTVIESALGKGALDR